MWTLSNKLMEAYGNSLCSPEQEGAFLGENSSVGELSVPLKKTPTQGTYWSPDKMTDALTLSQSGMTYALLTGDRGKDALTWCLGDSPASLFQPQQGGETQQKTSGPKCAELSKKYSLVLCLPKTSLKKPLENPQKTSRFWVMPPKGFGYPRKTWAQTTGGTGFGYVHTPTCTANYASPSMQKWSCCRNFVQMFGRPSPLNHEWLMGWPIGWTDCDLPATDKFRVWLRSHGVSS